MNEKRNFTRVDFKIHATVAFQGRTLSGEVENISLRGAFIRNVCVPLHSTAKIGIRLDSGIPDVVIRADAVAVRSVEEGTGFEFNRIDVDSFTHLRKIVSYAVCDGDAVIGEFASYIDHRLQEEELEEKK